MTQPLYAPSQGHEDMPLGWILGDRSRLLGHLKHKVQKRAQYAAPGPIEQQALAGGPNGGRRPTRSKYTTHPPSQRRTGITDQMLGDSKKAASACANCGETDTQLSNGQCHNCGEMFSTSPGTTDPDAQFNKLAPVASKPRPAAKAQPRSHRLVIGASGPLHSDVVDSESGDVLDRMRPATSRKAYIAELEKKAAEVRAMKKLHPEAFRGKFAAGSVEFDAAHPGSALSARARAIAASREAYKASGDAERAMRRKDGISSREARKIHLAAADAHHKAGRLHNSAGEQIFNTKKEQRHSEESGGWTKRGDSRVNRHWNLAEHHLAAAHDHREQAMRYDGNFAAWSKPASSIKPSVQASKPIDTSSTTGTASRKSFDASALGGEGGGTLPTHIIVSKGAIAATIRAQKADRHVVVRQSDNTHNVHQHQSRFHKLAHRAHTKAAILARDAGDRPLAMKHLEMMKRHEGRF